MTVFIAGPRKISKLNNKLKEKIDSICEKNFHIVLGDANGVDKAVQNYLFEKKYNNVTVFAINGKPRNNVGHWQVNNVIVNSSKKDFQMYATKDIEMSKVADYGFMIWNGISKGTLHNSLQLLDRDKKVLMYYSPEKKFYHLNSINDLKEIVQLCSNETQEIFNDLVKSIKNINKRQISLNIDNI